MLAHTHTYTYTYIYTSEENLTAGDDEPRVPTVIIERLHFPGAIGL